MYCNLPHLKPGALPRGAGRPARGLASPWNTSPAWLGLSKAESREAATPVGHGWVAAALNAPTENQLDCTSLIWVLCSIILKIKATLDGQDRLFLPRPTSWCNIREARIAGMLLAQTLTFKCKATTISAGPHLPVWDLKYKVVVCKCCEDANKSYCDRQGCLSELTPACVPYDQYVPVSIIIITIIPP